MLGIGVNVAVDVARLPARAARARAGTLGGSPVGRRAVLAALLAALERVARRARRPSCWTRGARATRCSAARWPGPAGSGMADGIDDEGRLVVRLPGGGRTALSAGEVHLGTLPDAG